MHAPARLGAASHLCRGAASRPHACQYVPKAAAPALTFGLSLDAQERMSAADDSDDNFYSVLRKTKDLLGSDTSWWIDNDAPVAGGASLGAEAESCREEPCRVNQVATGASAA